jgi:uncharacterized protein YggE
MRLPILSLAALLAATAPLLAQEANHPRQITVIGAAETEAVPDLATITAGVETRAETAAAALSANSEAMTAVFAALDAAAIERRDMQTSQLTLNPVHAPYDEGAPDAQRVVGYEAANLVTVRLRDVAALGTVVDSLAKAGANRLHGIGFELADPQAALATAREDAVADARARAELYARAAGVTLGPVLSIRETLEVPQPMMMRAQAMEAAAAPVAQGTVALAAQVEVVFGLE